MTDIEQAARAAANEQGIYGSAFAFVAGASWLAEYLLSDENVEKAHSAYVGAVFGAPGRPAMRAALSAVLGKEPS